MRQRQLDLNPTSPTCWFCRLEPVAHLSSVCFSTCKMGRTLYQPHRVVRVSVETMYVSCLAPRPRGGWGGAGLLMVLLLWKLHYFNPPRSQFRSCGFSNVSHNTSGKTTCWCKSVPLPLSSSIEALTTSQ